MPICPRQTFSADLLRLKRERRASSAMIGTEKENGLSKWTAHSKLDIAFLEATENK